MSRDVERRVVFAGRSVGREYERRRHSSARARQQSSTELTRGRLRRQVVLADGEAVQARALGAGVADVKLATHPAGGPGEDERAVSQWSDDKVRQQVGLPHEPTRICTPPPPALGRAPCWPTCGS